MTYKEEKDPLTEKEKRHSISSTLAKIKKVGKSIIGKKEEKEYIISLHRFDIPLKELGSFDTTPEADEAAVKFLKTKGKVGDLITMNKRNMGYPISMGSYTKEGDGKVYERTSKDVLATGFSLNGKKISEMKLRTLHSDEGIEERIISQKAPPHQQVAISQKA
jgi:hypothetical protein